MQAEELKIVVERVQRMEMLMDAVLEGVQTCLDNDGECMEDERECQESGDKKDGLRENVRELAEYMESGLWLRDYQCDERGELPKGLKRGVLSEDGLYNLLCDVAKRYEIATDGSRMNDK